jgi:Tfp pilus assembly protein PilF
MQVFLCHSMSDKPTVRSLYNRLEQDGFKPWFDEKDLIPGQPWKETIEDAVRASDAVAVCISRSSVTKEGFLNREIKVALDEADLKQEGTIFIIPVRLEDVEVPRRLREFQWTNLYEKDGYARLVTALTERAKKKGLIPPSPNVDKLDEVWKWMRTHLGLLLLGIVVALALFGGVAYRLYQVRKQYRAEAAKLYQEGIAKLRSFNAAEAEVLLGRAMIADPNNPLIHANLAVAFAERGNYKDAQKESQQAVKTKDGLNERDSLWVDGVNNEMNWRLQSAADSYNIGWSKYRDRDSRVRLAHVHTLSGKGSLALDVLKDTQSDDPADADPGIDYERALAADAVKDFDAEIRTLKKIVEDHPKDKEPLLNATALSQECWAIRNSGGNPEDAGKLCDDASELFTVKGDRLGLARALTHKAQILSDSDDEETRKLAAKPFNDAVKISHELGSQLDEAGALQNRANWFVDQHQSKQAEDDFRDSRALYTSIGNREGLAALENNWALGLIDNCQYKQAGDAFGQSLKDFGATNSDREKAIVTYNLGLMLYLTGDLGDAENNLKDALRAANKIDFGSQEPEWRNTLSEFYVTKNKLDLAERCLTHRDCDLGASLADQPNGAAKLSPSGNRSLALIRIESGRSPQAVLAMRALLQEIAKQKHPDVDEKTKTIDLLVRALLTNGSGEPKEASGLMDATHGLDIQDCRTRLSLEISSARLSSRRAIHENEFSQVLETLKNIEGDAKQKDLAGLQFEARLAQIETLFHAGKSDDALSQAQKLREDASNAKYDLIQAKVDNLVQRNKTARVHAKSTLDL